MVDNKSRNNITYKSAMQVRNSFGSVMDKAFYQNQYTVIERSGKPIAAIVPVDVVEKLFDLNDSLDSIIKDAANKNNLSYDKALDLASEAVKSIRGS